MKRSFNSNNFLFVVLIIFFIQILAIFISATANAHKVSAYAYREGDKVIGECYFVDGSPCKNSVVEIYDSKGKKILQTTTDEKGKFNFKTQETGELKIVIPAGEGHRAEYRIEAVERLAKKEIKKQIKKQTPQINRDEIKQIIDEAMDAKLQGIRNEILDLRKQMDKINIRDIIGGVGYIFGVWGLIMLIKRRKNAS